MSDCEAADQVAPHDSMMDGCFDGDTVVVIVFLMITVSTTTLGVSNSYHSSHLSPPDSRK